jgi:hypothetical protein
MKIVEITWKDAYSHSRLNAQKGDRPDPYFLTKTVGYLISRTREAISVAQTLTPDDGQMRLLMVVPMGMVKKVRFLR